MRFSEGISEIVFPSNYLTRRCIFLRTVQGKIYGVSILLNKGACFDHCTFIIHMINQSPSPFVDSLKGFLVYFDSFIYFASFILVFWFFIFSIFDSLLINN